MTPEQLTLLQRYVALLDAHRQAVDDLLAAGGDAPFAAEMAGYAATLQRHLAQIGRLLDTASDRQSRLSALQPAADPARALHTNGINGATGRGLPPFDAGVLFQWHHDALPREDPDFGAGFTTLYDRVRGRIATLLGREDEAAGEAIMGVIEGVDPLDPAQARWGIIFHPDTSGPVQDALQPLISYRAAQCGYADPQEAVFTVRRSEADDPYAFRLRHGQSHGDVDPARLPYYLLLVGPPTDLSWRFQYGLDAQHAVGRLDLPTPADYDAYVRSLIAWEAPAQFAAYFDGAPPPRPARRRALSFFAPDFDDATALSAAHLAGALHRQYAAPDVLDGHPPALELLTGEAADKAALHALLTRTADAPGIIFTATHGLYYPREDQRQRDEQGAFLCPGTTPWKDGDPIDDAVALRAGDITAADRFDGLLLFCFGCYTAGTPVGNDFPNMAFLMPDELAAAPFTARMAQRLLAQGALAVVGHVERAWHFSFAWQENAQLAVYRSLLDGVLTGKPLGHAMEYFNARFLDVNHHLTTLEVMDFELNQRDMEYFELWAARNDARGFVVLGDPLVRAAATA